MRKGSSRFVFLLVTLLVALIQFLAFAGAVQPDPVWIPGLYDDGDYNELLLVVTSPDSSVAPAPLSTGFEIILVCAGIVLLADPGRSHVIALRRSRFAAPLSSKPPSLRPRASPRGTQVIND
jgi:hypothetical protein